MDTPAVITARDPQQLAHVLTSAATFVKLGDANNLALTAWLLDSAQRAVREMALAAGASAGELP